MAAAATVLTKDSLNQCHYTMDVICTTAHLQLTSTIIDGTLTFELPKGQMPLLTSIGMENKIAAMRAHCHETACDLPIRIINRPRDNMQHPCKVVRK